jgi:hypothetical protein
MSASLVTLLYLMHPEPTTCLPQDSNLMNIDFGRDTKGRAFMIPVLYVFEKKGDKLAKILFT